MGLFGSPARDTAVTGSDADLIMVVTRSDEWIIDRRLR